MLKKLIFRLDEIRVNNNHNLDVLDVIEDWCNENLSHEWHIGYTSIYIDNEEDATAFKLRWL